jgi:uncharacterized protein
MVEVEHEQRGRRFILRLPEAGGEVAFLAYELTRTSTPAVLDLQHTFTPVSMRGKGVAGKLVAAAFAFARAENMKIIPTCSYIPVWVKRHPGEADLVRSP